MTGGSDRLEIGVLGPLVTNVGGRRIPIRGPMESALLARLALDGNQAVSTTRLANDLWADAAPRRPRQAIHALVFRLRQALDEMAGALQTNDHGYSLQLDGDGLDLWRFEALVAASRRDRAGGDLDAAARQLTAALAVWRGDALAGLEDCPFASSRARQLDESRLEALVERIEADLDRGLHVQLVPELEALVLQQPAHEGLCRLLMMAHYRCGRQVDALTAYERLREQLAGEFGLDPSRPLRDLKVEVLRQGPALDWRLPTGRPAALSADAPLSSAEPDPGWHLEHERLRGSLPHPLTSFIGRKAELAEVIALVRQHRLVTLTGSAGCGKTRLAIAAGHRLAPKAEVCFVRLESLTDAGLVSVAVAGALGVRLGRDRSAISALTDALAGRRVIILLDNCEHLLQSCADLVGAIVESAEHVRFLLTSREQLSVPGEVVRRLRPLATPQPGAANDALESAEAVRLFLDRAAAAGGLAEQLGPAALPAVAEVCRQLDGIPLAIELAAVRLATLSLDQLSRRLAERFSLLHAGSRTPLPRHRTLLAALRWSHDLLDEQERCLFRRLAVFASHFPLEAAEVVCAGGTVAPQDVCDLLGRLTAKSLVTVERAEGDVGYRLLNTVREYADSWLVDPAERAELARRHHDWCRRQAAGARTAIHDGGQHRWAAALRRCGDDIRAALDWALSPAGDTVALVGEMWPVWEIWGQEREGLQWIERALARGAGTQPADRANLLLGAAVCARGVDNFDGARRFLDQATRMYTDLAEARGMARCQLELGRLLLLEGKVGPAGGAAAQARRRYRDLSDAWGVAWTDVLAGNVLMVRGEYGAAAELFDAALAAGRRLNNPALVGDALVYRGLIAVRSGSASEAAPYFEEALDLSRMLDSGALANVALASLGMVAGQLGDHARALALLDEALAMARQRGEPLAVARILLESGEIADRMGKHARSQDLAADALRVYRTIGALSPVSQCLDLLARAAQSLGQPTRAATLLGAAWAARRSLGLDGPDPVTDTHSRRDKRDWTHAWEQGAELGIPEAIRFALSEV